MATDDYCIWYTDKIKKFNEQIWYPENYTRINDYEYKFNSPIINFDSFFNNNKFTNKIINNFNFIENDKNDIKKQSNKLRMNYINNLIKLTKNIKPVQLNNSNYDEILRNNAENMKTNKGAFIKKKNYIKKNKNICSYARSFKYKLDLNKDQIKLIKEWMIEANKVYNYCVELFNKDSKNFSLNFMKIKKKILDHLYPNKKSAPYDILCYEIKDFCANVKSCITNLKNGNTKFFEIKNKLINKKQTITIRKDIINKKGIYCSILGTIKNFNKISNNINCDCRLTHDKLTNNFYIYIPQYIKGINNNQIKKEVIALDPGEKVFMAFYGLDEFGFIGEDIRKPILKIETKIRTYQRVYNKCINRKGKKINKRKKEKIRIKIGKLYRKINGIVNELHKKTALFLCKNYKNILIPIFETQKMVKNSQAVNKIKMNVNQIKEDNKDNLLNLKKELKIYKRRTRLNGRVKFVLNMLSHYKFRQQLISKGEEYGCNIFVVTEEYTSQLCTKCGKLDKTYIKRTKKCKHCKYEINRDINGSRNILLKNLHLVQQ